MRTEPLAANMKPLKLGHVHLKVRDLQRSIEFYKAVAGLILEEEVQNFAFLNDGVEHHTVALQALGPSAERPNRFGVGLYHVAFEVASEEEYAERLEALKSLRMAHQSVDHGISWATYFSDPDGNGLEIYLDRRTTATGRTVWRGESTLA